MDYHCKLITIISFEKSTKMLELKIQLNFERSQYDYCLYSNENVYLMFFVDDTIILGEGELIAQLLRNLHGELK